MRHFECNDPNAQVRGDLILTFLNSFPDNHGHALAHELLSKHGIDNPSPTQWYPLQAYLNTMKDVHDQLSDQVLLITGKRMGESTRLEGEFDHVDYFVKHLDEYYHTNHKGEVGHYKCSDESEKSALHALQVTSTTPYACSYERGFLEGIAEHFKHQQGVTDVILKRLENQPCKQKGDDSCSYMLEWM